MSDQMAGLLLRCHHHAVCMSDLYKGSCSKSVLIYYSFNCDKEKVARDSFYQFLVFNFLIN